jgi:hypothetical protein
MLTVSGTGTTGTRLDWNESPFGPSPVAIQRVRANAGDLHRYPRGLLGTVTVAVAHAQGLDPAGVLLTNGVDEAIDLAPGGPDHVGRQPQSPGDPHLVRYPRRPPGRPLPRPPRPANPTLALTDIYLPTPSPSAAAPRALTNTP